jgi:hypothetical protein
MTRIRQVSVQEQIPGFTTVQTEETRTDRVEAYLRKIVLAALTMLGIGYVLVNASQAFLVGQSLSSIPIESQANVNAIAGRALYLMASLISTSLGGLLIFGAVKFYEHEKPDGIILFGVLMGSFYLLCLGTGFALLLPETNFATVSFIVAPILVAISAATYSSSSFRVRSFGSILGIVGSVVLAYFIFSFRFLDLAFGWGIPFLGPFMSLTALESVVLVLASVGVCVNSLVNGRFDERPLANVFTLLVAVVYGLGAFVGGLLLSMSFWNLIWKSPWVGPLHGLSEWVLSMVVFWSASLVLLDIGGLLLIVGGCLGFVYVAREFSRALEL